MAKSTGLGDQLFIGGRDIGADINSISNLSTPRATLPATAITQSAEARLFGLRDGQAEFVSYFNDATDLAHEALKGLPRTDAHLMYLRGTTLGDESIGMVGKQIDYAPNRGDDGSRSEEHTSELQSIMPISYAVFRFAKTTHNIICLTHHSY